MSEPVYGQCRRCGGPLARCHCPRDFDARLRALFIQRLKQWDKRERLPLRGTRDTGWPKPRKRFRTGEQVMRHYVPGYRVEGEP